VAAAMQGGGCVALLFSRAASPNAHYQQHPLLIMVVGPFFLAPVVPSTSSRFFPPAAVEMRKSVE